MNRTYSFRSLTAIVLPALLTALMLSSPGTVGAQVVTPGGGAAGGAPPAAPPAAAGAAAPAAAAPAAGAAGAAGAGGGGAVGAADGQIEPIEPDRITFDIIDERNQGFVGSTAEIISQNGFIGTPSQGGPNLAEEGRSDGGGINAGRGVRTATASGVQVQENGFVVQRQGLRSRLRPSFAAPATPGRVAERRFQSRMARQPVVQSMGQGINITVTNRVAIMRGVVSSEAERQIVKRQLRLEPGVYGIDDQTSLAR